MKELDKRIIGELEGDSRKTNREIAKKLRVSEGTVRKRVHKMVGKGLLKFTVSVTAKTGFSGIVFVKTNPQVRTSIIVENIRKIKEVKEIFEVTGDADIVLKVSCESPENFNETVEKLRTIKNVQETKTYAVLKIS